MRQQVFKDCGPTRAELLQLVLIESFLSIIVPIFAVSFQDQVQRTASSFAPERISYNE